MENKGRQERQRREEQKRRIRALIDPHKTPKENVAFFREKLRAAENLYRTATSPTEKAQLMTEIKELRATIFLYREFPTEGVQTRALDAPGGRLLKYNERIGG